MSISLTAAQWESIVVAVLLGETSTLPTLFEAIDRDNGLTRYYLWIRYFNLAASRVGDTGDLQEWPPAITVGPFISYSPFTKGWVEDYVRNQTSQSAYILVTDDRWGEAGWKELDLFFA